MDIKEFEERKDRKFNLSLMPLDEVKEIGIDHCQDCGGCPDPSLVECPCKPEGVV